MDIIICGSCYGTARQYAERLSKKTNISVKSYKDISLLDDYNTIIYVGALYAGGVLGMKETFSKMTAVQGKHIVIVTVGLADPTDTKNIENIRNSMQRQLSPSVFKHAHIYHLRGGIDYSRLSLKHKTMMWMVYMKSRKIPEEERTAEIRAMIETYNKQVNFVDFNSLESILNDLKKVK
jgi:menaquinone-dependent protoporphyrinogen IX oxidase